MAFKNEYKIKGNTTVLFIKRRNKDIFKVLIDTEDLELLKQLDYSWHVTYDKKLQQYYVISTVYLGIIDGKPKYTTPLLHTVIMKSDFSKGEYVDHKNHNTLDNRKRNLEIKSSHGNCINRLSANKNTTSGERNVSWNKKTQQWLVQLQVDGKNTCFGKFKYEELDEAIKLAKKLRKELYKNT